MNNYLRYRFTITQPTAEMSDLTSRIKASLDATGVDYEITDCDPEYADTAVYCEQYGLDPKYAANAILVKGKAGGERFYCLCVLLATHRLNTNHTVRKKLGARKVSFAPADETREITGMEIGGVTPFALPAGLPIWIDEAVMQVDYVVLGGGNRQSKIRVSPQVFTRLATAEVVSELALPMT